MDSENILEKIDLLPASTNYLMVNQNFGHSVILLVGYLVSSVI